MSTKCGIAGTAGISLYQEAGNSHYIYLEAETVTVGPGASSSVTTTIKMPIIIWEYLRQYSTIDLSLAQMTDKQLRAHVEQLVDQYIAASKKEGANSWGVRLSPLETDPSAPRTKQIRAGLKHFRTRRGAQQEFVATVKAMQWGAGWPEPSPTVASLSPKA